MYTTKTKAAAALLADALEDHLDYAIEMGEPTDDALETAAEVVWANVSDDHGDAAAAEVAPLLDVLTAALTALIVSNSTTLDGAIGILCGIAH